MLRKSKSVLIVVIGMVILAGLLKGVSYYYHLRSQTEDRIHFFKVQLWGNSDALKILDTNLSPGEIIEFSAFCEREQQKGIELGYDFPRWFADKKMSQDPFRRQLCFYKDQGGKLWMVGRGPNGKFDAGFWDDVIVEIPVHEWH